MDLAKIYLSKQELQHLASHESKLAEHEEDAKIKDTFWYWIALQYNRKKRLPEPEERIEDFHLMHKEEVEIHTSSKSEHWCIII